MIFITKNYVFHLVLYLDCCNLNYQKHSKSKCCPTVNEALNEAQNQQNNL